VEPALGGGFYPCGAFCAGRIYIIPLLCRTAFFHYGRLGTMTVRSVKRRQSGSCESALILFRWQAGLTRKPIRLGASQRRRVDGNSRLQSEPLFFHRRLPRRSTVHQGLSRRISISCGNGHRFSSGTAVTPGRRRASSGAAIVPTSFAAHRVLTSSLAPMRLIGRCLSPPSEADSVSAGHRLDAGSAPGPESALCGRAQKRRTATRKPTGKVPVKAAYAPRPGGGRLTLR